MSVLSDDVDYILAFLSGTLTANALGAAVAGDYGLAFLSAIGIAMAYLAKRTFTATS